MSFFSGIEHFFAQKRTSQYNISMFSFIYMFFSAVGIIMCLLEGSIFGTIIIALIALLSFILIKEVKTLHVENDLLVFQKNVISNSYDAAPNAFFIFSGDGKLIFYSKLAEDLFPGANIRNIDEFIELFANYSRVIPAMRTIQAAVEKGKIHHVDVPVVLDSNSSVWWRIFASPIKGFKKYSIWSITDLTPSFKNLETLEANSTFLLDMINSSPSSMFTIDDIGRFVFCNRAFSDLLGVPGAQVIEHEISDFIDMDKSDPIPVASGAGKLTQSLPSRVILKAESDREVVLMIRQIWMSKDGKLRSYAGQIHSEKSAELAQALCTTKLYFEKIFEDAPVGIAITDGAELLSACNKTFRDLTGYSDHMTNAADISLLSFISEESKAKTKDKLYELLNAVYSSEKPFEIQIRSVKKERTVMVYANKLDRQGDSGVSKGLVLYFIDVSDRKELQNQFVQSQKMQAIGQLAGGVAHDFNNLLTAMVGYCDLLLANHVSTEQTFADVMQIKQNANRASDLVRQLLAFSRQQTMQPKVLNPGNLIGDLTSLLNRLIGHKIELKVSHVNNVGCIRVDRTQFEQVMINLAVNARDAIQDNGELSISTENCYLTSPTFLRGETMPAGEYVVITVSDTGSGIPEEVVNRIFEPFFSTKAKGSGTGLGLSTVYGIVNQTGGFINVESRPGEGTKFTLYFPMIPAEEGVSAVSYHNNNSDESSKSNEDLTGQGDILLVEDEDAVRLFSKRALTSKGYNVIEAADGEIALEYIKREGANIDLMITDVVMPKIDGPTLINYVKDFAPSMKVIFISGYSEDSFRKSVANDTNVHFLAKPFNLRDLSSKVKEVIGKR